MTTRFIISFTVEAADLGNVLGVLDDTEDLHIRKMGERTASIREPTARQPRKAKDARSWRKGHHIKPIEAPLLTTMRDFLRREGPKTKEELVAYARAQGWKVVNPAQSLNALLSRGWVEVVDDKFQIKSAANVAA